MFSQADINDLNSVINSGDRSTLLDICVARVIRDYRVCGLMVTDRTGKSSEYRIPTKDTCWTEGRSDAILHAAEVLLSNHSHFVNNGYSSHPWVWDVIFNCGPIANPVTGLEEQFYMRFRVPNFARILSHTVDGNALSNPVLVLLRQHHDYRKDLILGRERAAPPISTPTIWSFSVSRRAPDLHPTQVNLDPNFGD